MNWFSGDIFLPLLFGSPNNKVRDEEQRGFGDVEEQQKKKKPHNLPLFFK